MENGFLIPHVDWDSHECRPDCRRQFPCNPSPSLINFVQESEVLVVHGIGALVTFVAGLVYCWGQVLIGHFMVPRMASTSVNVFRLLLCLIATTAFILRITLLLPKYLLIQTR